MEAFLIIGSMIAGYYLGKWLPLPDLQGRWRMFTLRALVIFVVLQMGAVFYEFRYYLWAALFAYVWKGFRYGAGLPKRPAVQEGPGEPEEARVFPRPPVGPGKGKRKKR